MNVTLSKKEDDRFSFVNKLDLPVKGLPVNGPQFGDAKREFGCEIFTSVFDE